MMHHVPFSPCHAHGTLQAIHCPKYLKGFVVRTTGLGFLIPHVVRGITASSNAFGRGGLRERSVKEGLVSLLLSTHSCLPGLG